jgi:phage major head subunit gpT-like protein
MFTSADNAAITRTQLDTVFFQRFEKPASDGAYAMATAENSKVFRQIPVTGSAYLGQVNKGSGLWSKIGEVSAVPQATPAVANSYTVVVNDYGNAIELSKNLFDDNRHDVWSEDVRQFAMMARVTQDQEAFSIFRTISSTTLTPDGVTAANSAHPLIGGGTQSNITAGPLSRTTLKAALKLMRVMKNQAGVVVGMTGKYLLVPVAEWDNAIEVTQSVLVSDSANNAVNVFRSIYGIEVMTSPYLGADITGGSDTNCFLLAENHGIIRVVRQGVQTALRSWEMSSNRTYLYQGNFRESVFIQDYSGLVLIGA